MTALFALGPAPSAAHSLKDVEGKLLKREAYLQVVHEPAPEFMLQDAQGRDVRLADLRGKVVVLNFVYT
ncbi:MAG: redoxin domain-containing protein, partial [Alphaproteobacteria bacterium]